MVGRLLVMKYVTKKVKYGDDMDIHIIFVVFASEQLLDCPSSAAFGLYDVLCHFHKIDF